MKKFLLMAAVATTLVNCSSDFDLSEGQGGGGVSDVIGFQVQGRNSIKRGTLQKANHYNFGVFAYKSTDQTNNIMDNYLVGYLDPKGYSKSGSTTDDKPGQVDGKSNWMYEGMGWAQFHGTYAGENVEKGSKYASNNENQYLRYWDNSAESTCFYAYVPYLNKGAVGATVSYVDGTAKGTDVDGEGHALNTDTYVMTFPNGTIKHGYDDEQAYEYMYASTKVGKANYGHDVQLEFKRLNAKVNIKFWEDIPGYSVHMIDLGDVPVATGTKHYTISAVPAKKVTPDADHVYGYDHGIIYTQNGVKIQFSDGVKTAIKQYAGETSPDPLAFATPTAAQIGENRVDATASSTTYFAIPKGHNVDVLKNDAKNIGQTQDCEDDLAVTGLTFHVSYELISTTGEKITVKDATVHVPANYCEWKENTRYTYIFKITTNSNGTTGSETPKPTDPSVPTEMALYPIVFDNCTVEEWEDNESEWEITDATNTWYDVQLGDDEYSFNNTSAKPLHVKVLRTSKNPTDNGETLVKELTLAAADLSVTGPNGDAIIIDGVKQSGFDSWKITGNVITVPAGATTGKYTITYKASDYDVNANNPTTYTENFFVGTDCSVNTNLDVVATNAVEPNTYLQILTVTDGLPEAQPSSTDNLEIIYPINLDPNEKAKVTVALKDGKAVVQVAQDAKPGKYKLVYKVKNVLPEDVEVKKVFEVKDYGLSLDKNIINLDNTRHTITVSSDFAGGELSYAKSDGTATVTASGMTITVNNNVAEGTYNVSYVVNKGTVSEATYKTSFEVKNTYAVTVDKTTISRDTGRPTTSTTGTDKIVITTMKNGKAANNQSKNLVIKDAAGIVNKTDNFTISPNPTGNTYELQVKAATANGTYTIEFKGQDDKVVKTTFIVQD